MWREYLWPLLAGTVMSVGLAGATSAYGVVGLLLGFAILSPFAVVVFLGLSEELAIDRSSAVRRGLGTALGVLVLLGLSQVFPRYGLVIAAVVALSSPTAFGVVGRLRRRFAGHLRSASAPPAYLMDPILLDRRFDEIVSQLRQSGDLPEP
jgi:hypothetical protein